MYSFHYPKIIARVGSALAKETVLSKVMNFVDGFTINLASGFDEKQKKYIDTILKLDNSKTIMMETKGGGVNVKNINNMEVVKGQEVICDFAEILEDNPDVLFLDYSDLESMPVGGTIRIKDVVLKVKETSIEQTILTVDTPGTIFGGEYVRFLDFTPTLPYLTQKDKKDLAWGLAGGAHMIVGSYVEDLAHMQEVKTYLDAQDSTKKIIARIETKKALENYEELLAFVDGVIFVRERLKKFIDDDGMRELLAQAKSIGKMATITVSYADDIVALGQEKAKELFWGYMVLGIDGYMLGDETAEGETPLEAINGLYEILTSVELERKLKEIKPFYRDSQREVVDYILYNAYNIMSDLDIRAVVCYTSTGYTPQRLSSFRSNVPLIAFTKSDNAYRYVNTLWGVRGYKVSQGFDYQKLKQVGKEMIRMMFKGSISLDEKILIVQVNEKEVDEANLINGIELYKFKDI